MPRSRACAGGLGAGSPVRSVLRLEAPACPSTHAGGRSPGWGCPGPCRVAERRGSRRPRRSLRGANAWTTRKVRGVCSPGKSSTGKVRDGRQLRPRPGSWSQQRSDRHATGHASALSPAPGRDGKDRQTDRQRGALRASSAARQDRWGRAEAGPLCTRGPAATGALSDALLHRVHGDVVVVAAHGQVRLRRRGG